MTRETEGQNFLNAALQKNYDLVKFSLENGIDVNTKDSMGENALTKALLSRVYGDAGEQQKKIINLLLGCVHFSSEPYQSRNKM